MSAPVLIDEIVDDLSPAYIAEGDTDALEVKVIAAMLAPLQPMVDIVLDERGPYYSIFDGTITDPRPLGWGAQWSGANPAGATEAQLRDRDWVRQRWGRGSNAAIIAAVRSVLTGAKTVRMYERRNPSDFSEDAPFHLSIVTRTDETPDGEESIVAALRPVLMARTILHISIVEGATWQDLIDNGITWQDLIDAELTWQDVADGEFL